MLNVCPVILSGGGGTRLWPMSRPKMPKQFLRIMGQSTPFEDCLIRCSSLQSKEYTVREPIIVTNERYRFACLQQSQSISNYSPTFLLEPVSRSTAPALTLAALQVSSKYGSDSIMVSMPADQNIDHEEFSSTLRSAINVAKNGDIVTIGIPPKEIETRYGYLEVEDGSGENGEFAVRRFREKPSYDEARFFLQSGKFFWNSGIFILKAKTWLDAMGSCDEVTANQVSDSWRASEIDGQFIRPNRHAYEKIIPNSIDVSVMENCLGRGYKVHLLPFKGFWADLGHWNTIYDCGDKDENNNVVVGSAIARASKNNLLVGQGGLVVSLGLNDVIVVKTSDITLVSSKAAVDAVPDVLEELTRNGVDEKHGERRDYRPWGYFDVLENRENYKLKRLVVNSGASLSLQLHKRRSEHWVVVSGVADVVVGEKVFKLSKNESTFVSAGEIHRLGNSGPDLLEVIEVQLGDYLGEDDIVRLDDSYGR